MPKQNQTTGKRRRRTRVILESKVKENYFGETLREFRNLKQLTQDEAAQRLGVTQSQWSSYEKGVTRPNLEIIFSIADKFEVDPLVLVGRSFDISRFSDPVQALTFDDYKELVNKMTTFRKEKLEERVHERVRELNLLIS